MLRVLPLSNFAAKKEILQGFQSDQTTWVVSDLQSKREIQKHLLQKNDVLPEDAVLRASELWRKLLFRQKPSVRVINVDLARTLIRGWLVEEDLDWARSPGAAQLAMQFVQQLLPVLTHPNGESLMQAWFADHSESVIRWGHWQRMAQRIWQRFADRDLLPSTWIAGSLINEDFSAAIWPRKLVVDLSAQITGSEVELLLLLANSQDVDVLMPSPNDQWHLQYPDIINMYDRLMGIGVKPKELKSWPAAKNSSGIKWLRFSTMLAEVKAAVAQARGWLEAGVLPQRIAILAPDIEMYWPSLQAYLAQEGLPVEKPVVGRLQSLPPVQSWLAALRLKTGSVSKADLEIHHFQVNPVLAYDRFARLYAHIYDELDLNRSEQIAELYAREISSDDILDRDGFVSWSLRYWPDEKDIEAIEKLLRMLLQDCPADTKFKAGLWLSYVESLAAKIEIGIEPGHAPGIHVLNLLSAEWLPVTHVFVMGMDEEALRQSTSTQITHAEISSLNQDLGFHLPSPDLAHLEFEARWLLQNNFSELNLSCAATDFSGATLGPSLLWLLNSESPKEALEQIDSPGMTLWDELQQASPQEISARRDWPDNYAQSLEQALREDLGLAPLKNFPSPDAISLSASSLESYAQCPFIFAARKVFHLNDLPELDLDIDRMTRGQILHAMFEKLTVEPMRFDWSQDELSDLLENLRSQEKWEFADLRLWTSLRARNIELAIRFLEFEKQWRKEFPSTQTVGREVLVRGRWDLEQKHLVPESSGEVGPLFTGRIDRVDSDGKLNYNLIDYKSTAGQLTNWGSWAKNSSLQLALYVQAIELGLTTLPPGPVINAVYYVARDFNRKKGFMSKDANDLAPVGVVPGSGITDVQRDKLADDINLRTNEIIAGIQSGTFAPIPQDLQTCPTCHWRQLCRAPHLS